MPGQLRKRRGRVGPLAMGLGVVALLAAAFVLGHLLAAEANKEAGGPSPRVLRAGGGQGLSEELGFPGVVLARDAVDLAPRVDGTLSAVGVALGDHVPKGAVLATVDVGPVREELHMAEAQRRAARAGHAKAKVESQLARDQLERDLAISQQLSAAQLERDRLQSKLAAAAAAQAAAAVAEADARVHQLEESVAGGDIRAPFDGVVTERYLAPGARVGRTTPVLRLIGQRMLRVRFAVPGSAAARVVAGTPVRVALDSLELSLDGEVQSVSAELDPALQTLVAEARLTAPAGLNVASGQTARIFLLEPRQAERHP